MRRIGDKPLQTVQADLRVTSGAFGPQEWESPIAGPKPDLAFAKHTALERFSLKKLRRHLRPVFETDVQRIAVPLQHHGSGIELAIDRGEVKTRRGRANQRNRIESWRRGAGDRPRPSDWEDGFGRLYQGQGQAWLRSHCG